MVTEPGRRDEECAELPRASAYLKWSRFPFVQEDPAGAVWLNDYRYANAGPYGWSALKLQ